MDAYDVLRLRRLARQLESEHRDLALAMALRTGAITTDEARRAGLSEPIEELAVLAAVEYAQAIVAATLVLPPSAG